MTTSAAASWPCFASTACEYHEPVNGLGECPQCDDSHRYTAAAVIRELREEWAVKNVAVRPPVIYPYGTPEAAVDDFHGAPPHVRQDLRLVHRYVTEWETDE